MSNPTDWIILAVYGDTDIKRALNSGEGLADDDDNPISPVKKAMDAARLAVALGKSTKNLDWDEEIGDAPAPKATNNFVKSSDERFKKTAARIRELFGPEHLELAEEAIALAEKVRGEAIAEVIASH